MNAVSYTKLDINTIRMVIFDAFNDNAIFTSDNGDEAEASDSLVSTTISNTISKSVLMSNDKQYQEDMQDILNMQNTDSDANTFKERTRTTFQSRIPRKVKKK